MASHRAIYKKRGAGFGNIDERRIIRAAAEIKNRRDRRSAEHTSRRIFEAEDFDRAQPNAEESQPVDRKMKLLKWKAEKELQKKIAMQKKLPAFRAGVIHHKLNSPQFLHQAYPIVKPSKPVTPRVTRATAKRMAEKKNITTKEKVIPTLPKKLTKTTKSAANHKTLEISFAPKSHKFKAPEGLPDLPLFGPEAVDGVKTEPQTVPVYFSPYVVSARGKEASRKEQLQNIELGEYRLGETESKDTDSQSTATSDSKDGTDVPLDCASAALTTSHFRKITEKEVVRLRALCEHWMEIKTDDKIPEDAQLVINQAIGQTNLLITKKIEQFKKLIVECETGCGEQLVTCQDLQGFWEMMYMQVENCDSRFSKLVKLQERNWEEESPVIAKKAVAAKKPPATKKAVPSKSSSVRDMIRAARRKQMESQKDATESLPVTIVGETSNSAHAGSSRLSAVKFDGGFFMVESPKKNVTPRSVRKTPNSQQPVFSDEASRRSALNLLRLSQRLKPPEPKPVTVETDPSILYVNSQQIPCKSILKRTDTSETASAIKRSQNKVIFLKNQESTKNNMSWLGESPNGMSDAQEIVKDQEIVNIKKKLDLSDDSNEESENEVEKESETSCNQRFNLLDKKASDNHAHGDDHTLSNSKTDETEHDEPSASKPVNEENSSSSVKSSKNNARRTRRSRQGVLNKHSEELVAEFSNFQVTELDARHPKAKLMETDEHQKENEKPESPEKTKRRRSNRKSVRFTGEECTACSGVKPVHPMTPRVRRRSSKLQETQNVDGTSTESTKVGTPSLQELDLISFDTPKNTPPRVRRSLRLQNATQR